MIFQASKEACQETNDFNCKSRIGRVTIVARSSTPVKLTRLSLILEYGQQHILYTLEKLF
jgi:hypothetical protein